jgi:Ser/Thr protein kinase RdoA (MazF antagonist)
MNSHAVHILKLFGLEARRIQKPPDAMLAQVYWIDDRYILRSRPSEEDTPVRFAAECALCDQVAGLTGYCFPTYERSASGDCFVVDHGHFWTLHRIIPGRPLGTWFELHRIDPSVSRRVLKTLNRLHTMTTGCFDETIIDRTRLLGLVSPSMAEARDFLSGPAMDRLMLAFDRVEKHCQSFAPEMSCFVHGDFHHGNILAQNGRIVGFIDLDWCRVGTYYEDFAFSLMMMLRNYQTWSYEFQWPLYDSILDQYGFQGDAMLLNDHLILYALFDCTVFKSSNFENASAFFEYQKQFLEAVCRANMS